MNAIKDKIVGYINMLELTVSKIIEDRKKEPELIPEIKNLVKLAPIDDMQIRLPGDDIETKRPTIDVKKYKKTNMSIYVESNGGVGSYFKVDEGFRRK